MNFSSKYLHKADKGTTSRYERKNRQSRQAKRGFLGAFDDLFHYVLWRTRRSSCSDFSASAAPFASKATKHARIKCSLGRD